jgi:hypothetical protein
METNETTQGFEALKAIALLYHNSNTVNPVYDHHTGIKIVVVVDSWSLLIGPFTL